MYKFKIGDKVRERPGSHETLSDGWLDRHWAGYWDHSAGTHEEGVYYVNYIFDDGYIRYHSFSDKDTGPSVPSESLELVEEEIEMNAVKIGSKWEFIKDPKFKVEVIYVNSNNAPVLKALSPDKEENIDVGDIFEYKISTKNFLEIYKPYIDIKEIKSIAEGLRGVFHSTRLSKDVSFTLPPEQALVLIEYLERETKDES